MRTTLVALLGTAGLTGVIAARPTSSTAAASIQPNNNRVAAGTLAKGVLTVRLEARTGGWQPDGPSGPTITTAAFSEVGKSLQTPGPLIRVPVGTTVRASVHNALAKPMWVYG